MPIRCLFTAVNAFVRTLIERLQRRRQQEQQQLPPEPATPEIEPQAGLEQGHSQQQQQQQQPCSPGQGQEQLEQQQMGTLALGLQAQPSIEHAHALNPGPLPQAVGAATCQTSTSQASCCTMRTEAANTIAAVPGLPHPLLPLGVGSARARVSDMWVLKEGPAWGQNRQQPKPDAQDLIDGAVHSAGEDAALEAGSSSAHATMQLQETLFIDTGVYTRNRCAVQ